MRSKNLYSSKLAYSILVFLGFLFSNIIAQDCENVPISYTSETLLTFLENETYTDKNFVYVNNDLFIIRNATISNGSRVRLRSKKMRIDDGFTLKSGSTLIIDVDEHLYIDDSVVISGGSKLIINSRGSISYKNGSKAYVFDNSHLRNYACGSIFINNADIDVGRCAEFPGGTTDCSSDNNSTNNSDKSKALFYAQNNVVHSNSGSIERRSLANVVERANVIEFDINGAVTFDIPKSYVPVDEEVRGVFIDGALLKILPGAQFLIPVVGAGEHIEQAWSSFIIARASNLLSGPHCPYDCGIDKVDWNYAIFNTDENLDYKYTGETIDFIAIDRPSILNVDTKSKDESLSIPVVSAEENIENYVQASAYDLHIYPNPAIQDINIKLKSSSVSIQNIRILNNEGKLVDQINLDNPVVSYQYKTNKIPRGMYYLNIDLTDSSTLVKKIVIIK